MSLNVDAKYPGSDRIGPLAKYNMNTVTTVGAGTITVAQFINGVYRRDPNGAGRSDTTPTAAAIAAVISDLQVGDGFEFFVRNDADANETITLLAGTGITIVGTATILQNKTEQFRVICTAIGITPTFTMIRGGEGIV